MGVLRVKVNGVWEEIAGTPLPEPALDEIWVGSESPDPANSEADLWLDNTVDPPTLKYKTQIGSWEPLIPEAEPPLDEVWVGSGPPDPTSTYELWINDTVVPAVTRYRNSIGAWTELGTNEVAVGTTDPYVIDPNSKAELWHDLTIGQSGKLKARWGGQWHPVAEFTESEVEIGATDPSTFAPPGTTELWVDSSTTPSTLKGWVNGAWQQLTGPDPVVPQEVFIGPVDPMDATTELWYDTTNSPNNGVLRANNFGVWEDIGGAEEVAIAAEDPYITDPLAQDELWYDLISQSLKVRVGDVWITVSAKPGAVSPQREYGKPPAIGTSDAYAREDHNHGTVPEETYIGPDDPAVGAMGLDPAAPEADFWYDTDATPSNATTSSAVNARFAALEARLVAMEARLAQGGN